MQSRCLLALLGWVGSDGGEPSANNVLGPDLPGALGMLSHIVFVTALGGRSGITPISQMRNLRLGEVKQPKVTWVVVLSAVKALFYFSYTWLVRKFCSVKIANAYTFDPAIPPLGFILCVAAEEWKEPRWPQ